MEPFDQTLEEEIQLLRMENKQLKEGESVLQELIRHCESKNRNLEEENKCMKNENHDIMDQNTAMREREAVNQDLIHHYLFLTKTLQEDNERIKDENVELKQSETTLREENQRLENEVASYQQRYTQFSERDLGWNITCGKEGKSSKREMWQLMRTVVMSGMEDRKRKRDDEGPTTIL